MLDNFPSSMLGKIFNNSSKLTVFIDFSNIEKSISLGISPQINSFLFLLTATESTTHNLIPLRIKGIIDVFILFPLAFPQAAIIPECYV